MVDQQLQNRHTAHSTHLICSSKVCEDRIISELGLKLCDRSTDIRSLAWDKALNPTLDTALGTHSEASCTYQPFRVRIKAILRIPCNK